ncbi:MAG: hypothetical protein M3396_05305 [Actinomycetota bacterium]|nr:hypothetical protein [Actinomycetota bacterium]
MPGGDAPRRRWLLPTVVLGGVVVVSVALTLANRGSSSPRTPPAGPVPAVGAPAPSPMQPGADGAGLNGSGPRTTDGMVPVGFARNESGAASAATSYISTLQSLVLVGRGEREAAVRRMVAPGSAPVVDQAVDGLAFLDRVVADARDALPGARVLVRDVPVAYTVSPFDAERARVRVWSVGIVLIEGRTEATEVWSTNTVDLAWKEGDWRVAGWTRAAGPTPATGLATATLPTAVLAAIDGWEGFRYVPSS